MVDETLLYQSFSLPPKQAIDYLAQKGYALSFNYDEIMHEAHHTAFTVAKVTRLDLLTDIHQSLLDAMQKGTSFKEWKKNLTPTLVKHGWYGDTTVTNPKTAETKDIYVGSRRLRTIFDTNMQVAYSAGRHREMMELVDSVYWRYVTRDDGKVRHSHALLHGMIRHRDDPIWKKIYPLNDWHCRCKVQAFSIEDITKRGWKITDQNTPLPDGFKVHPNWAYDIGAMSKYSAENAYWQKVTSITCKELNAKARTVLCPFADAVNAGYRNDMLQLLPTVEEWMLFVDRALDPSIKRHEELRLGYLSLIAPLAELLSEIKPQSDLILADTGSIRNLRAKSDGSKDGKVLTVEEIKSLHDRIHTPDEIYYDGDIVLVWDFNKGKNKVVIKVNYQDKNRIYNALYSGQKYKTEDIDRMMKDAKKVY